jgi:hypothetical protein
MNKALDEHLADTERFKDYLANKISTTMDPLSEIAARAGTDKGLHHHGYTPVYHKYFESLRDKPIKLLELGFGGYDYPDRGGEGARMWAEYFHNGQIITTDIHPKNLHGWDGRILFRRGSQTDETFLAVINAAFGPFDIIIDDASHISAYSIKSFETLFQWLNPGGIYVVEDLEASYWSEYEFDGTTNILDLSVKSSMNYFKMLADGLNFEHLRDARSLVPWFSEQIESIHFYKKLCFIFKKEQC